MPDTSNTTAQNFVGTLSNDNLVDGFQNELGAKISEASDEAIKVNGHEGDDIIKTSNGNSLAVGDMVGSEWAYVDGKWVHTPVEVTKAVYDTNSPSFWSFEVDQLSHTTKNGVATSMTEFSSYERNVTSSSTYNANMENENYHIGGYRQVDGRFS